MSTNYRNAAPRRFGFIEWSMAWRYLRSRRKESVVSLISLLSFLGIMLGVAALIVVMAVMNGFRGELLDRILGVNGHLVVRAASGGALREFDDIAARLQSVPGVRLVAPVIDGQALAASARTSLGAHVRGQRGEDVAKMEVLAESLPPEALEAYDEGGALVGARLAQRLGLQTGDEITLLSPRGPATPFGISPRQRIYPVAGLFRAGMAEIDSSFVFLPLEEAQQFFSVSGRVGGIEVLIDDPASARQFIGQLSAAAAAPVEVRPWQKTHATLAGALAVERNVMFVILSLIILVAALNIISGMVMLVKDKRGEIAILRAMGAPRGMVTRIFLMAGFGIGVAGSLAGLGLGLVLCDNIELVRQALTTILGLELFPADVYFLDSLPADVDPVETASAVLMALFLSFAATLYPAWRAASLDPVDVLRYE